MRSRPGAVRVTIVMIVASLVPALAVPGVVAAAAPPAGTQQAVPTPGAVTAESVGLLSGQGSVSAGYAHSCSLSQAGGVRCWGWNRLGQLGNGSTADSSVPVGVFGLSSGVAKIDLGNYHTCVVTSTGGAKCWGLSSDGQLGNGSLSKSATPVDVSTLTSGVASISVGGTHTCAVTTVGGAKCWGDNGYWQLGNDTDVDASRPTDVTGLTSGVASISAGIHQSCAVTTGGGVKCWGQNVYGTLGDGTRTSSRVPVDVVGLTSGVASVAVGLDHVCALTTAGAVKCWGHNQVGQLGNGTTTDSLVPVEVSGLSAGVAAVSTKASGDEPHTCVLTTAGAVSCWGANTYGELGNGTTTRSPVPVAVSGLSSGVVSLAAGYLHSCVVVAAGGVKCWGANDFGDLGDGTTTNSSVPVSVADPPTTGVPAAPGIGDAVSGFRTATLSWTLPASDGGKPILGYTITPYIGNAAQPPQDLDSGGSTIGGVFDLHNGATYTFTVRAYNANGLGPESDHSNAVTPLAPATGLLRVVTSPAVSSQISVDGHPSDTWGLDWVKLAPGVHQVCFSDVTGWTAPPCQDVTVSVDETTSVTGHFVRRGYLRVTTSPEVASRISIDGIGRNNYGIYTDLPDGEHEVCFGPVAGYSAPPCQTIEVVAGEGNNVNLTGTFTPTPGAPALDGVGYLRVTTSPAVRSQISVDGNIGDSWALNWLETSPGAHQVCFSRVAGFTTPPCQTVNVTLGNLTQVQGVFGYNTYLKVVTNPPVPATITINDVPADDWGVFTDLRGQQVVCFGDVPDKVPPPCQTVRLFDPGVKTITANYTPFPPPPAPSASPPKRRAG